MIQSLLYRSRASIVLLIDLREFFFLRFWVGGGGGGEKKISEIDQSIKKNKNKTVKFRLIFFKI